MWKSFQVQKPLKHFSGEEVNDQQWLKRRRLARDQNEEAQAFWVCWCVSRSQPAWTQPRRQRPGRVCDYLRVGFSLKVTPEQSSYRLHSLLPPLSKSRLSYNCTWVRVIFVCQASIRYQTQRTKINPKEQRKLMEVARCFPRCHYVKVNLYASPCSQSFTFKSGPIP